MPVGGKPLLPLPLSPPNGAHLEKQTNISGRRLPFFHVLRREDDRWLPPSSAFGASGHGCFSCAANMPRNPQQMPLVPSTGVGTAWHRTAPHFIAQFCRFSAAACRSHRRFFSIIKQEKRRSSVLPFFFAQAAGIDMKKLSPFSLSDTPQNISLSGSIPE